MKRALYSLLLLIIVSWNCTAQNSFQRTYGSASMSEKANIIKQTTDKGYILCSSAAFSLTSSYLVKADSLGIKIWSKAIDIDVLNDIIQTSDGGYLIAGGNFPGSGFKLCYLLKLDALGNITWQKEYDATILNFVCLQEAIDGKGYIVAGNEYDALLLMKMDLSGSILWVQNMQTNLGFQARPSPVGVVQLAKDSSFYVLGDYINEYTLGGKFVMLSKFRKDGSGVWTKTVSTNKMYPSIDKALAIKKTFNGNLMMSFSSSTNVDFVQLDTSGTAISQGITYGFPVAVNSHWDFANPTADNSLLIAYTDPTTYYEASNIILSKTDPAGNVSWTKKLGGKHEDEVNAIIANSHKEIVIAGSTKSFSYGKDDIYLLKSDITGAFGCNESNFDLPVVSYQTTTLTNTNCSFKFIQPSFHYTNIFSTVNCSDTSFNACGCIPPVAEFNTRYPLQSGTVENNSTWGTMWIWDYGNGQVDTSLYAYLPYKKNGIYTICLKVLNACGSDSVCHPINYEVIIVSTPEIDKNNKFRIYPNPFSSQTTIEFDDEQKNAVLRITDLLGKDIRTINFSGKELILEKAEMKPGIYFIQIIDENKNATGKKIMIQ
jgi:hypothetical protein